MKPLFEAVEDKKFDVRVVSSNVKRGFTDRKTVEAHLQGLEDDADKCEWVNLEELAQEPVPKTR